MWLPPLLLLRFPPCAARVQLEKLVEKNYFLNKSAKDAYRGYLLAYASHGLKEIFNVHALDLVVRAPQQGFAVCVFPTQECVCVCVWRGVLTTVCVGAWVWMWVWVWV